MYDLGFPTKILSSLFYIAKRSKVIKPKHKIEIPQTVYITDEPVEWFFTDKEGYLKKKKRLNVNADNIYKAFCKKELKNGIVAQLIYLKGRRVINDGEDPAYVVEYLNKKKLSKSYF